MKTTIWCCSALSLAMLIGCEKKEEPLPTTPLSTAAPEAAPIPAAVATPTVDLEKVSVEEQFEKEVEAEVTPANFEKQLDALEKELQAE